MALASCFLFNSSMGCLISLLFDFHLEAMTKTQSTPQERKNDSAGVPLDKHYQEYQLN